MASRDTILGDVEKLDRAIQSATLSIERMGRSTMLAPPGMMEGMAKGYATPPPPRAFHGSYERTSRSLSQYLQEEEGVAGGSYTRKSYTLPEYQVSQQKALGHMAGGQEGGIPTAGKADGGMGIGKDQLMQAAGKFNTRTSDVGGIDKMDVARAAMGDPSAMVNLAVDTVQHSQKNWAAAGDHLTKAAFSKNATGAASGALRGAGSAVSAELGPIVGPEVEKVFKFGAALVESIDKLRSWGNSLHDANMQFAEFSGSMAAVQARQEVRDIHLSRERGNRRAEDAETLAKAKNRMDRAMAPIDDAWNNLQNRVAAWLLETVAPVVEQLAEWLPKNTKADDAPWVTGENQWMGDLHADWAASHGKPMRFGK